MPIFLLVEFESGAFNLKTHHVSSAHATPASFENGTITVLLDLSWAGTLAIIMIPLLSKSSVFKMFFHDGLV